MVHLISTAMTRRSVVLGASANCLPSLLRRDAGVALIKAPSNLGLKPLAAGHKPGAWRAPDALVMAGLISAVQPGLTLALEPPTYFFAPRPGSRIRNGPEIRAFSEKLARRVAHALTDGWFPLVVGGDCSILLGCLLGAHSAGTVGLIHVDGHSDFYHPGNYDTSARLGSAAGMDLALATGRGEPLLALWDERPLVEDAHVVQIGERDELDPDYDYRDIEETLIRRLPVRHVLRRGVSGTVQDALAPGADTQRPLWLHLDLDALDAAVMPAVDSPGSPGLTFSQLDALLAGLLASRRVIGMDVSIYDPELDPNGVYAREIVSCLGRAISTLSRGVRR